MKINPVMAQDAIMKYQGVGPKQKAAQSRLDYSDSLELSEGAQKFSSIIQDIRKDLDAADGAEAAAREEKLAAIAASVKDGSYQVDGYAVARSMLGI